MRERKILPWRKYSLIAKDLREITGGTEALIPFLIVL